MIRPAILPPALLTACACLMLSSPAIANYDASVAIVAFNSCEKPAWPEAALAEKRTGTVTLSFDVDEAGKLVGSSVVRSSGHADLDEAAREGISKCDFRPGMKDGLPVRSTMRVQYVWTLK